MYTASCPESTAASRSDSASISACRVRGFQFTPQALVFLALAPNVFLALALSLFSLSFRLFFFAFLALRLLAFLSLALGFLFLIAQFFEALLFDERILTALLLFGQAPELLAVVRLRLGLLDDRFRLRLWLRLDDRRQLAGLGHLGDEGRLHGQRRERCRTRILVGHDHRAEDHDVQQQGHTDRNNVFTIARHAPNYSGIG